MIIRQTTRDDLRTLRHWIPDAIACARWAGPDVGFPFTIDSLCEDIKLEPENTYSLAGTRSGLLGLGQLFVIGEVRLHLARLIVHPEKRDRQLGRIFCAALIKEAYARWGLREVTLNVESKNLAAIKLYQRLGFKNRDESGHSSALQGSIPMALGIGDLVAAGAHKYPEFRVSFHSD